MRRVYLGLGSNAGCRVEHLQKAVTALRRLLAVERLSSVYETAPMGYAEQSPFLNMVVAGTSARRPHVLLAALKALERTLGRQPTFVNGPREIDMDIIDFGGLRLADATLELPHPRAHERAFVLVPLYEIAGDMRLGDRPVSALLKDTAGQGVRFYAPAFPL